MATVKEFLNMSAKDFRSITDPAQLRKTLRPVIRAANKRLSNLSKQSAPSPAYRGAMQSGGRFSAGKGASLKDLQREFVRLRSFMEGKTSTVAGWKAERAANIDALKEAGGPEITAEQFDSFFRAYDMLAEMDPRVAERELKYRVMDELKREMDTGRHIDEIVVNLYNRIDELYEQQEAEYNGAGAGFSIGGNL